MAHNFEFTLCFSAIFFLHFYKFKSHFLTFFFTIPLNAVPKMLLQIMYVFKCL